MTDLFGGTTCALDRKPAAAHVSDRWSGAWLCKKHLTDYELQWRAIGRTVDSFLHPEPRA